MANRTVVGYTEYTTVPGDTFDVIAFKSYTDELLSSEIIAANPNYIDTIVFEEPVKLKIPVFDSADLPETLPPWRR